MVAFRHALANCEVPMEDIRMCSVGTMTGRFFLDKSVRSDMGLMGWTNNNRLSTMMVASQQQFTINMMRDILDESYVRLDTMSEFGSRVDMSSFSLEDLNKICDKADRTWRVMRDDPLVKSFLR